MKNSFVLVILLIALGVIPLLDLLHGGLPITHDGQDHVARIANFYQNLQDGNIIPRWAGNLNWGYGHPILMFLYPLPSYVASFFHFIGLSFVDATKAVFAIAFILSGLNMFIWINSFLNEKAAFVAGVLYMFAPYRFVDLYVRGAIGEHVAFIFPPLILFFLFQLSKKLTIYRIIGGSIAMAGLILSHNAITLMFLPVIFLYTLYLLFTSEEPKSLLRHLRGGTKSLLGAGVLMMFLGFGLAAFFWLPAFFEGKYTLRDIVISGEYSSRFVAWKEFILGPWSYGGSGQLSVQVGITQWIIVFLVVPFGVVSFQKKNSLWMLVLGSLLVFLSTLFLMTSSSSYLWEKISILQKFQFPWRFLLVTVFISSVLGGLLVFLLPKRMQLVSSTLLIVLLLWFNKDYWHAKAFLQKEENFYTSVYNGTTDTGESAPIWSIRFMLKRPAASLEAVEGIAKIRSIRRTVTRHQYEIITIGKTRLRENTLYFPGWFVYDNGKDVQLEFQDPRHRGLMTFYLDKGKHDISVVFRETKLRSLANAISIFSFGALLLISIGNKIWRRFQ